MTKAIILLINSLVLLFSTTNVSAQDTLYNQKYTVACHNCYEKKYSCGLDEMFEYTSTIELDIWDSRCLFSKNKVANNDWYVKHTFLQRGNKNCFDGSLKKCLQEIAKWSEANPNHEPVTVFLDKKEGWRKGKGFRQPEDLDNLIHSTVPAGKVFTPKELLSTIDLKSSIKTTNWPSVNSLKGKIIFVLTDAAILTKRNNILNRYLDKRASDAVCFVAPLIKKEKEIEHPKGIAESNAPNVVFYNLKYKNSYLSKEINCNNYINRVYKSPETVKTVSDLTEQKVNFIAMYNYRLRQ